MCETWSCTTALARKFGKYVISNLMMYIVAFMAMVYALVMLMPVNLTAYLVFNKAAILRGQLWRLVTFLFLPSDSSIVWILFSLCFYWMIGSALENQWGSFRFNMYYLFGMLGTIISGMITGYATNSYLNLSLFLGLALLYPDFQVNLFFFLPGLGEVSGADRRGGAGGELRDGHGLHPHRACDGAFERAAVLRRKPDSARQERVPPLQMEEIVPGMNPTGSLRWMKQPCLFLVQSCSGAEGCGCSVSVWGTMLCMMFSR